MTRAPAVNVLGGELASCASEPVTGFFRDGCCNTSDEDAGCHTVCSILTREFLEFSASRGNDLMTARPEFGFPGLQSGQRWCLCALRWLEAARAGCAPRVHLEATHQRTLEHVPLDLLRSHALDATH